MTTPNEKDQERAAAWFLLRARSRTKWAIANQFAEVRAEVVAEIVAWLRDDASLDDRIYAEIIERKWGGRK